MSHWFRTTITYIQRWMKCLIFILDNSVLSVIFIISFHWVDLLLSLNNSSCIKSLWLDFVESSWFLSFTSEFILDLVLMKKTLFTFLWHIFIICFKFIQMFRSSFFRMCDCDYTHSLRLPVLPCIKTSTSFLKGSNRV